LFWNRDARNPEEIIFSGLNISCCEKSEEKRKRYLKQ
jgi:hypothetical protein